MSQSSDDPIRQARRRGWASKILPDNRAQEMHEIARKLTQAELEEIAQIWLMACEAADGGDNEAKLLAEGTLGPWAAEIMRLRAS